MSENQYNAPAMEVVEFGKEDIVCIASPSVKPGGGEDGEIDAGF